MTLVVIEFIVILLLLVVNGIFSMTEMAVVSSRKTRLRVMAASGNAGARTALALAESPNRFLPSVQFGITLVGLLAGAFGGITLAEQIATRLKTFPLLANYAEAIGVAAVVVALTYLSLIIGELVPKRIALANPEGIASRMARPMDLLSRAARPVVWLLGVSTDLVFRVIGGRTKRGTTISDDEVKLLLSEGVKAGVFHQTEPRMIESVLAFDQRPVRDIMTPQEKLMFLNVDDPHETIWHKIVVSGHSNYPVYSGNRERVVGVVSVKSIYANSAASAPVRLHDLMLEPLLVAGSETVTELLEKFKTTRRHIALITDVKWQVVGMVTLVDVLEAIVGEMPSREERLKPQAVARADGSLLVDGDFPVARLAALLKTTQLARSLVERSATLARFVTTELDKPAREGTAFTRDGVVFEIIDMDGERIDKVLVSPAADVPHKFTNRNPEAIRLAHFDLGDSK
jgi:putative hemolysin